MSETQSISAQQARAAIDAIVAASEGAGFAVAIAVVDEHGDLIAAHRMDGCRPRSIRMTQRKAYTAAVMDRDTTAFQDDIVARQIQLSSYGEPMFSALPGGVVVRDGGGNTIGAVGVTGNTKNRDAEFAAAGLPFLRGKE
jgi:glc operon protein GlcG